MPATTPAPVLLELLRCPEPHHAPLSFDREANCLTCSECDKEFRVEDGIPVMLLDDVKEELQAWAQTTTAWQASPATGRPTRPASPGT